MKPFANLAIAMDHQLLRDSLADLLTTLGYHISIRVSNGRELIKALRSADTKEVVCIIDVRMSSGIDGPATCSELKKQFPNVKVIGYSMSGDPKITERMKKSGADRYVPKGSDLEMLLTAVTELAA